MSNHFENQIYLMVKENLENQRKIISLIEEIRDELKLIRAEKSTMRDELPEPEPIEMATEKGGHFGGIHGSINRETSQDVIERLAKNTLRSDVPPYKAMNLN